MASNYINGSIEESTSWRVGVGGKKTSWTDVTVRLKAWRSNRRLLDKYIWNWTQKVKTRTPTRSSICSSISLSARIATSAWFGDPNSAIYVARAHPLNYPELHEGLQRRRGQKLEKNYRSTKKILDVANKVIAKADMMWRWILQLSTDRRDERRGYLYQEQR